MMIRESQCEGHRVMDEETRDFGPILGKKKKKDNVVFGDPIFFPFKVPCTFPC